jgi:hypothetical protein
MTIDIPEDLATICRLVVAEGKSDDEWAEIESDDMFQEGSVHGGYDATERAFCFSYYRPDGEELWLQLTLTEVAAVAAGSLISMEARLAE